MLMIFKNSGIDPFRLMRLKNEPIKKAIQELIGIPMSHILESSEEDFSRYLNDINDHVEQNH